MLVYPGREVTRKGLYRRQGLKKKKSNYVSRPWFSRVVLVYILALGGQKLIIKGYCVQQVSVVTVYLGDDLVLLAQAGFIKVVIVQGPGKLCLHWSSHLRRCPPSWFHQSHWPPWRAHWPLHRHSLVGIFSGTA